MLKNKGVKISIIMDTQISIFQINLWVGWLHSDSDIIQRVYSRTDTNWNFHNNNWTCVSHSFLIFSQPEGIQTCTVPLLWKIPDKSCSKKPHSGRSRRTGCGHFLQDTFTKRFWWHGFCYDGGRYTAKCIKWLPAPGGKTMWWTSIDPIQGGVENYIILPHVH